MNANKQRLVDEQRPLWCTEPSCCSQKLTDTDIMTSDLGDRLAIFRDEIGHIRYTVHRHLFENIGQNTANSSPAPNMTLGTGDHAIVEFLLDFSL